MSSESDSEVFFDAEEGTPVRTAKIKDKSSSLEKEKPPIVPKLLTPKPEAGPQEFKCPSMSHFPMIQVNEEDVQEAERKAKENEKRRRKVEELRNRMLKDDDEGLDLPSEQSSLTSSVEGFYPSGNSNLRANAALSSCNSEESRSMVSLGKVGMILGGKSSSTNLKDQDNGSTDSKCSTSDTGMFLDLNSVQYPSNTLKSVEPDLVASTKPEKPVAPPRKKRKNKTTNSALTPTDLPKMPIDSALPSPTDPVENLARELECSLDLNGAMRGQYVVKPQDREQDRAESSKHSKESSNTLSVDMTPLHAARSTSSASDGENSLKRTDSSTSAPCLFGVRTRTDSGRPLTDQEILEQVTVMNLDTGEQIPLSLAEEHLPRCLNPLSLHIMRRTAEYVSNTALDKERESDEESIDSRNPEGIDANRVWNKTMNFGRILGRNIENGVHRLKTAVADRVHHSRHGDDEASDDEGTAESRSNVEIKVSSRLRAVEKGRSEFEKIKIIQELTGEHTGAIWTMKFSSCGRLLATAGQDHDLRIWVLRHYYKFFDDMRQKFNAGKSSPTPSQESSTHGAESVHSDQENVDDVNSGPFMEQPFRRYKGHTAELLDVSWSKNYFILSSSMDKTVRLWQISRQECLCCFQHIDFVTAIAFHPRDDRYFLSGSLDGKLRLWNIPDKKVTLWDELNGQTKLITAVNFYQNGKIAVVGSYDGRCIFYHTEQLKYHTQIHVRSSRGRNKQGRKISGIEAMPGEDKILVTSNDSRIRLYDLRDLSLSCKYKGYVNLSSQIKASFSHDGKYIISGSENQFIYIWKTFHDYAKSSRRDRNEYWERIKAHNAVVTSAVFAPNPSIIVEQLKQELEESGPSPPELGLSNCYVMVSADFCGTVKVFLHKPRSGATNLS